MAERSKELIMVGYFLSRFGKKNPPSQLKSAKWKDAYKLFYTKLNEGRKLSEFEHSLKNSRDAFDGYFSDTEREGWKGDDGNPSKLTGYSSEIFDEFESLNEADVFEKIANFISPYTEKEMVTTSRFDKLDLLNKVFNYSWIYKIQSDRWNLLLSATKTVLEGIIENENDDRLVISLRNDNKKRLAVIFGQKYVGGFYLEDNEPITRFYIDADFDVSKDPRFQESDWQFSDKKGKLIYCSPEFWQGQDDSQYKRIRKSVSDLLETCGKSGFKRTHLPFMYDVILNSEARQQFLEFITLDPEQRLLEAYRQYLDNTGNEQELYKWEIGKQFQENWDLDAEDFGAMLKSVKLANLIAQQSGAFIREARKHPQEGRAFYKYLLDESNSISERINWARDKGAELIKEWRPGWKSAGQDERTLSVLWSFSDLKNHALYKSSFYTKYCDLIGVKPKKSGGKYEDYLGLLDQFLENYLNKNTSLVALHNSFLDPDKHISDPNNRLMAQNVLFRILDGFWNTENEEDEMLDNEIEVNQDKSSMNINLIDLFTDWLHSSDKYWRVYNRDKNILLDKLIEYERAYYNDFGIMIFDNADQSLQSIVDHIMLHLSDLNESNGELAAINKVTVGNGSVKAILGQNNYVKFLEELIMKKSMSSNIEKIEVGTLNTILYGPPGTGKTYNTINKALEIIGVDISNMNRNDVVNLFESKVREGQITFITFHQSFSYEDFIEGIKPVVELEDSSGQGELQYRIENGIFKELVERINNAQEFVESDQKQISIEPEKFKNNINKVSLGNSLDSKDDAIYDYCMANDCVVIGFGEDIDFSGVTSRIEIRKRFQENGIEISSSMDFNVSAIERLLLWMEPGQLVFVSDGMSKLKAIGEVSGEYYCDPSAPIRYAQFRKVKWLYKDLALPIEEIYGKKFSQQTIYQIDSNQIDQSFFSNKKGPKKNISNYVLIIDEINRGNVSSIFGELITLLEPDKRKGAVEELSAVLPYSKKRFSIPKNLYILGTMNTADRSVEALDSALRRRFSFKEMLPNPSLLKNKLDGFSLEELLTTINERIEVLVDRDHTIGHAFFMGGNSLDDLRNTFANKVIPLLQEYFYGDYGKMEMVIGTAFFKVKDTTKVKFAVKPEDFDPEGKVYHIVDVADKTAMSDEAFKEALTNLIKGA